MSTRFTERSVTWDPNYQGGAGTGTVGHCKHGRNMIGCQQCLGDAEKRLKSEERWVRLAEALDKIPDATPVPTSVDRGWQCPVCRAVWAPFHRGCDNCAGKTP